MFDQKIFLFTLEESTNVSKNRTLKRHRYIYFECEIIHPCNVDEKKKKRKIEKERSARAARSSIIAIESRKEKPDHPRIDRLPNKTRIIVPISCTTAIKRARGVKTHE